MTEDNISQLFIHRFDFNSRFSAFCEKTPSNFQLSGMAQKSPPNYHPNLLWISKTDLTSNRITNQTGIKEDGGHQHTLPDKSKLYHKRGRYRRIRNTKAKAKVKYFDPNNAPLITSPSQFMVKQQLTQLTETTDTKVKQIKMVDKIQMCEQLGQTETNPFIIFKHRREPKKYKKYISADYQSSSSDSQ